MKEIKKPKQAVKDIVKGKNLDSVISYLNSPVHISELSKNMNTVQNQHILQLYMHDYHTLGADSIDFLSRIFLFYSHHINENQLFDSALTKDLENDNVQKFFDIFSSKMNIENSKEHIFQLLKSKDFKITEQNKNLLSISPALLEYYLKDDTISIDMKKSLLSNNISNVNNPQQIIDYVINQYDQLAPYLDKIDSEHLLNLYKLDCKSNNAIISEYNNNFYQQHLNPEQLNSLTIDSAFEYGIENYLNAYPNMTSFPERDSLLLEQLKQRNYKITEENKELLTKCPVLLHHYLTEETISLDEKRNIVSSIPAPNTNTFVEYVIHNYEQMGDLLKQLDPVAMRRIYALDYKLNKNDIPIERSVFYQSIENPEVLFQIRALTAVENDFLDTFLDGYDNQAINLEREKFLYGQLQSKRFQITEENKHLLFKSPVLMYYYLYDDKISVKDKYNMLCREPDSNNFIDSSAACSPVILSGIYNKTNELFNNKHFKDFDYIKPFYSLPLATAALKQKSERLAILQIADNLTKAQEAEKKQLNTELLNLTNEISTHIKSSKSLSMNINNIEMIMQNLNTNSEKNINFLCELLASNNAFYNTNNYNFQLPDEEMDSLMRIMKNKNLSCMILGPSFLKNNEHILMNNGFLSSTEVEILNRNVETTNYDKSFESLLLDDLKLENTPASFEEFITTIKDKNMTDLSLAESNIILGYAKKILAQEGILDNKISYSHEGKKDGHAGIAKGKDIIICIGACSVESILYTIHHEASHVIQNNNCINMRFENDKDILTYGQDYLLRYLDPQYYDDNYYQQSHEFDADFKAHIMNQKLFNQSLESNLDEALDSYYKLDRQYSKQVSRTSNDEIYESREELLNKKLQEKFATASSNEIEKLKNYVNEKHPIIALTYDLNTGKPYSISELIDMVNNEKNHKIKKTLKYIIQYKCDRHQIGKYQAKANREELSSKLNSSKENIDSHKLNNINSHNSNLFDKYESMNTNEIENKPQQVPKDNSHKNMR